MSINQDPTAPPLSNSIQLTNALRDLWVDNISWMTSIMYSVLFGADTGAMQRRLDRNTEEFGALFDYFYGKEIGNYVRDNFTSFINEMILLMKAYRDDDLQLIEQKRNALFDLADDLSLLMSKINPYWERAPLQAGMYSIISAYEEEIVSTKTREYKKSIQAHDRLQDLLYKVSDEMSAGIIQQFQV